MHIINKILPDLSSVKLDNEVFFMQLFCCAVIFTLILKYIIGCDFHNHFIEKELVIIFLSYCFVRGYPCLFRPIRRLQEKRNNEKKFIDFLEKSPLFVKEYFEKFEKSNVTGIYCQTGDEIIVQLLKDNGLDIFEYYKLGTYKICFIHEKYIKLYRKHFIKKR